MFERQGEATGEGLSAVTGATAFGKGVAGLAEGGVVQLGGAYKDVKGIAGNEAHDMPADSVSLLSKGNGPSISMDAADHAETASYGSSRAAKAYRETQRQLIAQGKFREAQQMDVQDLHNLFGNKYKNAIRQAIEYTNKLGL